MVEFKEKSGNVGSMYDVLDVIEDLADRYDSAVVEIRITANGARGGYDYVALVEDRVAARQQ